MRLLLVLAACSACSAPAAPPALANTSTALHRTLALTLERTECFANYCPVYTLRIASDGSVAWHGEAAVALVGDAHAQIAVIDLERMVAAFEHAGFFELSQTQRRFVVQRINGKPVTIICGSTDAPSTKVTITREGATVTHEWLPCASELDDADKLVDELVGTARWIGPRPKL